MSLGSQNVESARLDHALAQLDVGSTAGHVGGDGDGPWLPGLRDDGRLFGMMLRVQDLVRDTPALQHL